MHGDYRIDNTMLDAKDATKVRAVLDWEMSTLGDPLSDAALMCVYRHPMFDMVHADAAWASPQIPSADELAHRYSLAADQPLAHWDFYMALAYFKLAIIAAGIQFRDRMGGGTEYGVKVGEAVAAAHLDGADRTLCLTHDDADWSASWWGTGKRTARTFAGLTIRRGPVHVVAARQWAQASRSARNSTCGSTHPPRSNFRSPSPRNPGPPSPKQLSFTLNGNEIEARRSRRRPRQPDPQVRRGRGQPAGSTTSPPSSARRIPHPSTRST